MDFLPTLLFLVAVFAVAGDAVVHFVFANLVEERIDEVHAAHNAESQVPGHNRRIRRNETATLDDGSDQSGHNMSIASGIAQNLGCTKRTDPKRETIARTVCDNEEITTEISWFLVMCNFSAGR